MPDASPETPQLRIRRSGDTPLPHRAHADDAGLDLASAEDLVIPAGGRALVDTGLALALPPGTVGLVCPRSGLAAKHGITVLNGPGVVDAGYRGPVKVALHNTDLTEDFALHVGDRIAQLVIVPFLAPAVREVEDLDETDRAASGFGSSGGFGAASAATAPVTTGAATGPDTTEG
ncbi:dUTP diphosphatase [Brachybacterium aquaticum]|uniref:dUTP diphosphatase n=1 Tax=Brachybacterium aquaticum TaxID=1432564 RepID=A0A841A9T8_9MICO|nr:dUTP diphosphatase [Brachybacterium aquaticum]MBB5831596.1 dUTP pyrophosphatase [Brachybacterium aquaticum]